MALPIAAAPIAKMFLDAIGLSIAGLAAKDIVDVANKYIEDNPKESVMILKTLVPNLGIGEIFMKKGKDEEVEEEVDIEDMDPRDLTDAEKRKIMRDTAKSGGDVREKMKEAYEKFIKPGQDRTFEEAEERYEGGLEDVKKPPFDYKRFFRKADGGAIGVESLFEEKKKNGGRIGFRRGGRRGNYGQASYGASTKTSTTAKAPPSMGFGNPPPGSGGGGGGGSTTTKTPPITRRGGGGPNLNLTQTTTPNFGLRTLEFAKKYNPLNLLFGTPVEAEEIDFSKLKESKEKFDPSFPFGFSKDSNFGGKKYTGKTKGEFVDFLQEGGFGLKTQDMFDKNIDDLFEGVADNEIGTGFTDDATPTFVKTGKGLDYTGFIDVPKKDLGKKEIDLLPGGFFPTKKADGGRIGLKDGLMPEDYLYSMDKDAKGFLIGEDSDKIPEGLPEDYLFKIDDEGKIFIVPTKESEDKRKDVEVEDVEDIIERDTPRVGILSGFSPLAFLRKYLAKKELEAKEENKADGGRVGFNVGGITDPAALSIYNSMSAYGFSDQEIADAITAQGYDAGTLGQTTTPTPTTPTTPTPSEGIIGIDLQNARDGDSPMLTPFKKDPRVGSAFEAYQRSQALKAMGIEDPFADEVTLGGAYYEDMPNVDLRPGSQTFMGKLKSGMDSIIGLSPTLNLFRGVGQGIANLFPVNQRSIKENIAGNMGIRVDDIGRIVNTGDYNAPENVMAGYGLNKLTDKSFDKRIDSVSSTLGKKYNLGVNEIKGILEGTLSDEQLADINSRAIMKGTNQTTNLIKQLRSLQIAKERNKFIQDAAKAEADRQKKEREAAKLEKQRAKTREADRAAGAFSNVVQLDPGGGGTFKQQTAAKERQGVQVAGPGFGRGAYFAEGGLASMFVEKR